MEDPIFEPKEHTVKSGLVPGVDPGLVLGLGHALRSVDGIPVCLKNLYSVTFRLVARARVYTTRSERGPILEDSEGKRTVQSGLITAEDAVDLVPVVVDGTTLVGRLCGETHALKTFLGALLGGFGDVGVMDSSLKASGNAGL